VDLLPGGFIRNFIVSANDDRASEEPRFRAPGDADPDGPAGDLYPVFLEPREGTPAPGEPKGKENNERAIVGLILTGGMRTGTLEKFRRKVVFDFWIRAMPPQLPQQIGDRLRLLLHDKRNWDMAGLTVIESMLWRPLQPVGHGPQGYSYTMGFLFELYAESGN
jgi:hypothetical protein